MATRIILIILIGIAGLIGGYIAAGGYRRLISNVGTLIIVAALLILFAAVFMVILSQKVLAEHLAVISYFILILGVIYSIVDFIRGGSGER